ncbi:MAG TPA: ComF family protein [Rhodanobacteraceae bacterium]
MDRARLARWISHLPLTVSRCLMCGAPGTHGLDLCPGCLAELPRNTVCCTHCALPMAEPGRLCGRCQIKPPPWQAVCVPFRYAWPLDHLAARYKFAAQLASGRSLAALWHTAAQPERPAAIIPVPLHHVRLRQRGYDQALELARVISRDLHVPLRTDILWRRRATTAQSTLDAAARRRNVRDAFTVRNAAALPAHVAVFDDVMTTGTTLAECTRVLQRAGVARVDVWALARVPAPGQAAVSRRQSPHSA